MPHACYNYKGVAAGVRQLQGRSDMPELSLGGHLKEYLFLILDINIHIGEPRRYFALVKFSNAWATPL